MTGLGRTALETLVRCYQQVTAEAASPERDALLATLHRALVGVYGVDLGPRPERWGRAQVQDLSLPTPRVEVPASRGAWVLSLWICAGLAALTGLVMFLRPAALVPFLTAPLAGVALIMAWWDVLADAAHVSSQWVPSLSVIGLSITVGLELALLMRRKPWVRDRSAVPPA